MRKMCFSDGEKKPFNFTFLRFGSANGKRKSKSSVKKKEKGGRSCETCARKGTTYFCALCPDYRHWKPVVKKVERKFPVAGPKTRAAGRRTGRF